MQTAVMPVTVPALSTEPGCQIDPLQLSGPLPQAARPSGTLSHLQTTEAVREGGLGAKLSSPGHLSTSIPSVHP